MSRVILRILLLLIGIIIYGLKNELYSQSTLDEKSLAPLSPNAAELYKYSSTPVDMMTGTPSINFPLYEINTGRIKLPISLSYHASGIKVDQRATWVGLGWSLNAGGIISRSVRGMADETSERGWFNDTTSLDAINSVTDYYVLQGWCDGNSHDTHPDFFTYSLPGSKSGKFIYSRDKKAFITLPFEPIVVSHVTTNPDGSNSNFYTIVDDDGTKYFFEAPEGFLNDSWSLVQYRQSWYLTRIVSSDTKDTVYLNYANGVAGPSYSEDDVVESYTQSYAHFGGSANFSPGLAAGQGVVSGDGLSHKVSTVTHGVQVLKEIIFRQGKVTFYAGTVRSDVDAGNALDSVVVYSNSAGNYKRVRSFAFNYDYFSDGISNAAVDYRLKLLSFSRQDINGGSPETYQFDYNSVAIPQLYSHGADYWGFNNGKWTNSTLLPNVVPNIPGTHAQAPLGSADRNPDDEAIMAGMLQKITYPTKGYTTFQFEPNKYKTNVTTTSTGTLVSYRLNGIAHLRQTSNEVDFQYPSNAATQIGTITIYFTPYQPNDDIGQEVILKDLTTNSNLYVWTHTGNYAVAQTITQTYSFDATHQYGLYALTDDATTGYIDVSLTYQVVDVSKLIVSGGGIRTHSVTAYNSDNTIQDNTVYKYGSNEDGVGIMLLPDTLIFQNYYEQSVKSVSGDGGVGGFCYYTGGTQRNYTASASYSALTFQGAIILYDSVAKYQLGGSANVPNGKTVYAYNMPNDYQSIVNTTAPGGHDWIDNSLFNTQMARQQQFVYHAATGAFTLQAEDIYGYTFYNGSIEKALNCWINTVYPAGICPTVGEGDLQDFGYTFYNIKGGCYRLTNATHFEYDDNGNKLQTQKLYTFNNPLHLYPNIVNALDSKGDTLQNQINYPGDHSNADVNATILDQMVVKNMLSNPYLKSDFNNSSPLRAVRTIFANQWDANVNLILPQKQSLSVNKGALSSVAQFIQYVAYDSYGNPLQVVDEKGVNKGYLWDYNTSYPVAEILNATQADIAYTSFEADGTGNWALGSASRDTVNGFTGTKSYILNSDISRSGLTSTTTYIVSYWTRNTSPFTISGTISGYPVKGKTISYNNISWTLYTHRVTGQTTITLSGSGPIDELRLYPLGAQMTTYTYTPLVGMTSQTDMGNRVTYYEYDGLQRLMRIRDQDHNILKSLEYQYQVSSGCGPNCYSITMQTLAGTNTLGYPVGVFDVHGTLLGNATGPVQYVSLWNADTADARIGTLSTGSDSLHFSMTLNTGMTLPPGVTGCRYYQFDMAWNQFDAVRNANGAYVDFGDSTGMHLPNNIADTAAPLAANTICQREYSFNPTIYYLHTYPDTTQKTLTFYHNDAVENEDFDNGFIHTLSLVRIKNLRGNLPQHTTVFGGSSYQQTTMTSVANILNWNSISSIQYFRLNNGDVLNPAIHLGYTQDFMKSNKGLLSIYTSLGYYVNGYRDTTFKLSRLKSDWNTYFTSLQHLQINDEHWNREDLSALTQLNYFQIYATTQNHQDDPGSPLVPIPFPVIDNILNQIANGAGQTVSNGAIDVEAGGPVRTTASDAAVRLLLSNGWVIAINGVLQHN